MILVRLLFQHNLQIACRCFLLDRKENLVLLKNVFYYIETKGGKYGYYLSSLRKRECGGEENSGYTFL